MKIRHIARAGKSDLPFQAREHQHDLYCASLELGDTMALLSTERSSLN